MALLKELKARAGTRPEVLPRLPGWAKGQQAYEIRLFCLGIGIPSIKFHTLRACFATQLIRNGVPPIQIQKVCGWKLEGPGDDATLCAAGRDRDGPRNRGAEDPPARRGGGAGDQSLHANVIVFSAELRTAWLPSGFEVT